MSKKQSTRPRSIRRRLTRLTFAMLMVVFIAIGVATFYVVRTQARAGIGQTHGVELIQLSSAVQARLESVANEVRSLANSVNIRQFAGQTITLGGTGLNDAQQRMLGDFVSLAQSDPDLVVEIRYVTRSGSVWTRVTNADGIAPDTNVYLNKMARDISLSDTLRKRPGEISMDVLTFATDINGQRLSPLKPILRFSAPVAAPEDNANVPGIVQVDVAAGPILNLVTLPPALSRQAVPDRKLVLFNQNGQILVDTSAPADTYPARGLAGPQSSLARYTVIDKAMITQFADFRALQAGDSIFSGNRVTFGGAPDMPWWLLLIDNTAAVLAPADQTATVALVGILALGFVLSLAVSAIIGRSLRPLTDTNLLLQRMTQPGSTDATFVPMAGNDEIGQLVGAFERMSGEMRDMTRDRDRQAGRFNRGMEMAARVGRETAALDDSTRALRRAADLIVDEYGYLYTQVFLLDDVRDNAVLVYAHGAPDTEPLSADYRAAVGDRSIIGTVTGSVRTMTDNDITPAARVSGHPIQPAAQAELAVPLVFAGEVLGALDIQSKTVGAFGDEEIRLFQLLADAIAAAMHNARLVGESRERNDRSDVLNRQMTRSVWEQTEQEYELEPAYRYDLMQVERGEPDVPSTDLSASITIRGEVIGTLAATAPEGMEFTQADQQILRAVAERVALAIENARLFAETQSSLTQTSALYQISRYLNEADTLEDIVEAVVVAVMPDAIRGQVAVFSETTGAPQEWLEIRADWSEAGNKRQVGLLAGRHFHVPEVPLLAQMTQSDVLLIGDIAADERIDGELRALFSNIEAAAAVVIPFSVRGHWRGVILVEFPRVRAFSPREARIYGALIDQIGVAVDNRQLFAEAQAQAQRALALAEVGQLASRIGSRFEDSIAEVFTRVARAAQYDRWLLMLTDPTERWLQTVTMNMSEEVIGGDSLELATARHPIAESARSNMTLIVNEPSTYPAFAGRGERFWRQIGKHVTAPVRVGESVVGALLIGRPLNAPDLSESDEQLINTLAAQVAVAVENRRLFQAAQDERQTLRTTLETLPAGVLVLDGQTYRPVQYNEEAVRLLRKPIDPTQPFDATVYNLVRSGTHETYPANELPIYAAGSAQIDDVAVLDEDGRETALLVDAAPLFDARGVLSAVVVAFTDISVLRVLENSLQDNLRDTVALYEATRSLTEAPAEDEVFDVIISRMSTLNPTGAYVLMLDQLNEINVARSLDGSDTFPLPREVLNSWRIVSTTDVSQQSEFAEVTQAQVLAAGVAAFVSVPLRSRARGDEPMGWVVITFDQPRALSAQEERFVTTLSDSAAVALENRSLFRSTESALAETASLYRATTSISRARDLDELIHTVADSLGTLLPDVSGVYLFDQAGQGQGPRELFSRSSDGRPVALGSIINGNEDVFDQPVFLSDLTQSAADDPLVSALLANGITTLASATLRAKGVAQGCVVVGFRGASQFAENEVRYLGAIADSTSVVLDNIFLFDQIQATLDETSLMYQSSRALGDSATPDDVLKVMSEVVEPSAAVTFLAMLDGGDWHAPGAFARLVTLSQQQPVGLLGPQDTLLTAEQFPAWRQLGSDHVVMFEDVDDERMITGMERLALASLGVRAVAVIPLAASRRALGALVIGWAETHKFSPRDLRIYQSFAEQASLKLDAARLLAQTERRARQLATSAEVSRYASTILDLNELLPRIANLIRDLFGYDHTQIFLMDAADEYAVLRASTGEAGRQLLAVRHRLQKNSASVIGQVTAGGEPVVSLDTAATEAVHRPNPYLPNTRSEMAVPLILKNHVVGALDVQSNLPNAFDADDVAVLTTLAGQVSVAIDNANLFEEASQRASEMSFLFGVTTAAASAQTLTDALQNVAAELQSSMSALSVTVYLPQNYVDIEDNRTTMLKPVALAGSNQPLSELSEINLTLDTRSLIARVAASLQPQLIGNIEQETGYVPVAAAARSAVVVPLTYGTELVGLVNMESRELNAYNDDTLTLLLTLSGTLSAIVQNQQLLEQVQQTNEQLRELDRLKSDFLANMSHELRTPLNSIIGFSRVILKGIDGPLTEMQEQDLSTIYTSGQHLLNLINDILDQAKLNAGKMDLQSDYFEMKSVIDGVRSIGIGLVKDKSIDIRIEADSGLPPAYGDEFRTRQVLLNLVSNASKFTRDGSITLRAYVEKQQKTGADMIRVDVIDTGIGIAEKDLPLLFEAFRQIDSSLTRTVGGTGLGLPIAKSLIEMQGGEMQVQSQVNIGSVFSILMPTEPSEKPKTEDEDMTVSEEPDLKPSTPSIQWGSGVQIGSGMYDTQLPMRPPTGPTRKTTDTLELPASRPPMIQKRQILIIEDNPEMVDQFRRALQREGYDIYAASIPLEAEAMASGLHPTIVILDVNFANGVGWNILGTLKGRDDTRDIPVIVVTLSEEEQRARDNGAFRFIRRPFVPETLTEAVAAADHESRIDRILIIDDQPEHARLLEDLLQSEGNYHVFSAGSGQEGVAMVARRRPNLVILDLRMPDMDGFSVAEELRANPETANIPILVVTGEALVPAERERLHNLEVVSKTDISMDEHEQFMAGVKMRLTRSNGV